MDMQVQLVETITAFGNARVLVSFQTFQIVNPQIFEKLMSKYQHNILTLVHSPIPKTYPIIISLIFLENFQCFEDVLSWECKL